MRNKVMFQWDDDWQKEVNKFEVLFCTKPLILKMKPLKNKFKNAYQEFGPAIATQFMLLTDEIWV